MKSTARALRLIALVLTATVAGGCMGSFVLTKKLYGWNETVTGNKLINQVIFWGLNILPVYSLAVTVDAVILNLIEFWTGSNLMADASTPGANKVAVVENADGSVTVTRGAETFTLVPVGEDQVEIFVDGVKKGTAERTLTGGIVAYDVDGQELAVLTPEERKVSEETIAGAIR